MSARNRFFILLGIIFVIAAGYYYFSTDHSDDLVLIGRWTRIRSSSAPRWKDASRNCWSMKARR